MGWFGFIQLQFKAPSNELIFLPYPWNAHIPYAGITFLMVLPINSFSMWACMHAWVNMCWERGDFSLKMTCVPQIFMLHPFKWTEFFWMYLFFLRSLYSRSVWNYFLLISLYPTIVRIFFVYAQHPVLFVIPFLSVIWILTCQSFQQVFSHITSSIFWGCSILLQYPRLIILLLPFIFYHSNSSKIGLNFLLRCQGFFFLSFSWTSFFSACCFAIIWKHLCQLPLPYLANPSTPIHSFPHTSTSPSPSFKTVIYN